MSFFEWSLQHEDELSMLKTASIRPRHGLMRHRRTSLPALGMSNFNRLSAANSLASFDSTSDHSSLSSNSVQLPFQDTHVAPSVTTSHRLSMSPELIGHPTSPCRPRKLSQMSRRAIIKRACTAPVQRSSSPDLERRLQNAAQRQKIATELVETERSYLQVLTDIKTNFFDPLNTALNTDSPILDRQGIADVFSNFTDVLNLAREMLRRLEQGPAPDVILETEEDRSTIGRHTVLPSARQPAVVSGDNAGYLLLPLCPFLKCYSLFIQNFSRSLAVLQATPFENPVLHSFLVQQKAKGIGKGFSLDNLLLSIVQRIPRYRLLVTDLLNRTEDDHPDFEDITNVFRIVDQGKSELDPLKLPDAIAVATHLNSSIRMHEAALKLIGLQKSIQNLPLNLVEPGRRLIKQGLLTKVSRRDEQPRMFFLFSDLLLYATRSQDVTQRWSLAVSFGGPLTPADSKPVAENDQSYIFNRSLPLKEITVVSVDGRYFEVRSTEKSFAVAADTLNEKEAWITAIRGSKDELLASRRTLATDSDEDLLPLPTPAGLFSVSMQRASSAPNAVTSPSTPMLDRDSKDSSDFSDVHTPELASEPLFHRDLTSPSLLQLPLGLPIRRYSEESSFQPQPAGQGSGLKVAENYLAPVWVPDSKAKNCMRCRKAFGLWRRKHHCRLCGVVVCYACSSQSFIIPATANQEGQIGRACDACYDACFESQTLQSKRLSTTPTLPDIAARMSLTSL